MKPPIRIDAYERGQAAEKQRILDLIWEIKCYIPEDGLTKRDRDAMDYILWQYRNRLQQAIKEGNNVQEA